jgi:AcrR family transcriptional regulator
VTPSASSEISEKRQAIIDATRELIIENGVESTSLAQIADAVGISKGTLYYYYASKSDLIFDVTQQHFDRITHDLWEWIATVKDDSDPEEIFKVVFETVLRAETRGKLHLYLVQSVVTKNPALKERYIEKYREWQTMIRMGLDVILGEDESHATLAALALAALDGFIIQDQLGVKPIPMDEIVRYLVTRA